ncbi:MAG: plasmid pRiA4b ORF-3 family protein [Acidobacteria bacterium]|nr:plasmid pRiA4b ORF-3 family protein [Acidobacteriota bacterium]
MSEAVFVVLRLELQNVEPLIWRVVRVPGDLRLRELHRVLQTVMGWGDRHPHSFADGSAMPPDENLTIVEALAAAHSRLTYVYDEQLAWRLRITRARGMWRPGSRHPIICLDGYLAGPRDGTVGPLAYSAILAGTLGRGPKLSRDVLESLGPGFDPERFDRSAINRELAQLRGVPASAG